MKRYKILIFLTLFLFASCGTVKEGFQNPKKNNSDEFLVEKKNPLILPPDYDKLPKPISQDNERDIDEEGNTKIDFSKIFNKRSQSNSNNTSTTNKSLEDSIRKKIGNN